MFFSAPAVLSAALIAMQLPHVKPLNYQHMLELFQQNCSAILRIPIREGAPTALPGNDNTSVECPPWFQSSGDEDCSIGPFLHDIIQENGATLQTFLLECNCMTVEKNGTLTVGACLYTCNAITGYFPLPCRTSELNNFTCMDLNRDGRLCGECTEDHAPPVYSYDLRCVECKNYHYNWLKYLGAAFLPLTVFFFVVTIFSISFTSPRLSGVVTVYQMMANPIQLSVLVSLNDSGLLLLNKTLVKCLTSLVGVWNLDFFRLAYDPFCLHPNMTTLHTLALDYAIAVYPLVLIMVTYVLVSLHDRGFRPVKLICGPFGRLSRKLKQPWDVKTSLIDVFASFIFLSTSRLLSASFILLIPSYSYSLKGSTLTSTSYVFNAPNVAYLSSNHLPFALTAVVVILLLNLLPMMLLFVYPLKSFQRLLNKLNVNSNSLRTFIEVFQGSFKDGTSGTRDYRFFSGFLLLFEVVLSLLFWLIRGIFYYPSASICILLYCILIASCQPYKRRQDNYITVAMLASFLCTYVGLTFNVVLHKTLHPLLHYTYPAANVLFYSSCVVIGMGSAIPFLYLLGLVIVLVYTKVIRPQCIA